MRNSQNYYPSDPIRLEIYKYFFASIAEEMGAVLRKASFSPNIKERRDFSCAVFDQHGNMIAQAAHIPVHLGSMPMSVQSAVQKFSASGERLSPGDTIIVNDPFLGGTHLPDITLVSPLFFDTGITADDMKPVAYVANRAHHADIGGISPGSMPIAREIFQEGLIIPPVKFVTGGTLNQGILDLILANVRTPEERSGDLKAQIGANQRGITRLTDLIQRYGLQEVSLYMQELLDYTEHMTRRLIAEIPDGKYTFSDNLDDNGVTEQKVRIQVSIKIEGENAEVDFTGSAEQQPGSINAVYAITLSAVNYVFRSLIGLDVPNNSGCLVPIKIIAPQGTVVNALHPAPVAGGNVETSQRIVDVLLGAFAQACPERIPAASQGTMNNVMIGGWDIERKRYFTYYETIGGGTGASPQQDGFSAVHSHMTNTLNTPIEALEYAYPLQVTRYAIHNTSGGEGIHRGGDGIIREIKVLCDAQLTLLSERRVTQPYGLSGGEPGQAGENQLIHEGQVTHLPGKGNFYLSKGDILSISTPGGGGFGPKK
ncbi:MAG: 5-oxoprolinase [Anaerolineales bacterium]|nr:MAG: 5-oxoprolinase [Anaerolineales bacterium]